MEALAVSPSALPSARQLSEILLHISQQAENTALDPTTQRILMGRLRVAAQLLTNAAICDRLGHHCDSAEQRRIASALGGCEGHASTLRQGAQASG